MGDFDHRSGGEYYCVGLSGSVGLVSIPKARIGKMVGILVHGNNHFILKGPRPDEADALRLARYWSVIQIGVEKSQSLGPWEIRTKEFRENLEWAVIVPGDRDVSPGVMQLLGELAGRGIEIHRCKCRL